MSVSQSALIEIYLRRVFYGLFESEENDTDGEEEGERKRRRRRR